MNRKGTGSGSGWEVECEESTRTGRLRSAILDEGNTKLSQSNFSKKSANKHKKIGNLDNCVIKAL